MQCGWLLTIANLGDSRAVLDTGAQILQLSVDHRVATHRGERHRLERTGALIAPIDVSGEAGALHVAHRCLFRPATSGIASERTEAFIAHIDVFGDASPPLRSCLMTFLRCIPD